MFLISTSAWALQKMVDVVSMECGLLTRKEYESTRNGKITHYVKLVLATEAIDRGPIVFDQSRVY